MVGRSRDRRRLTLSLELSCPVYVRSLFSALEQRGGGRHHFFGSAFCRKTTIQPLP
jgi:hypothetical protein